MDQWKASGSRSLLAAPVSTMDAPGLTLFFNGVNETFSAGSDLQPSAHHHDSPPRPHKALTDWPTDLQGDYNYPLQLAIQVHRCAHPPNLPFVNNSANIPIHGSQCSLP